MISTADTHSPPPSPQGRPLKGVGLTIAQEQPDGSQIALGVIFARSTEKLEELIQSIHGQKMTVNLASIRPGILILEQPPEGGEG